MTHHLRWPDEPTGLAALQAGGFTAADEDGAERIILATHTWAIDVVGPIWRGGSWDTETGEQLTPPVLLPGWHVNFIGDLPEAWAGYVVTPLDPVRVFA
jgi:hypothetical protein